MSDPQITSGDPLAGYTSPPPPGAGGVAYADPLSVPSTAGWELSGWWRRVWAQVIDGIVIGLIALVFFLIIGAIVGGGFLVGDTTGYIAAVLGFLAWGICILVAALLYAPLMMAKTNGKTLGRMALGIRVVPLLHDQVTARRGDRRAQIDVATARLHPRQHHVLRQHGDERLLIGRVEPHRHDRQLHRGVGALAARAHGRARYCAHNIVRLRTHGWSA